MTWYPASGQLALIELLDESDDGQCLTGVVVGNGDGSVVIDLGASPRPTNSPCDVVASFFTPEALYRVTGVATERAQSPGLLDLEPKDVEQVQRRAVPRVRASLPVALSAFDQNGDFSSVTGTEIAPEMWPASYSTWGRTSSTTTSPSHSRLRSWSRVMVPSSSR